METKDKISDENTNRKEINSSIQPLAGILSQQDETNKNKALSFLSLYPELDTSENRVMINNVKSLPEGIQIGPIVRNRNFMEMKDKENIGKKYIAKYCEEEKEQVHIIYNDEYNIYQFSRWEANNYAERQGLDLPTDEDIQKSLEALPGIFSKENRYVGGNILGILLGLPPTGYGKEDGELVKDGFGYFRTKTDYEEDRDLARGYIYNKEKGLLDGDDKFACLPAITVAKRF